jgi:hypothetical protein
MATINSVILGALKVQDVPERASISTWEELIKSIPTFIGVELPTGISNVIVGNVQPQEEDRDKLWIRRDNNGTFIGFYAFCDGKWSPVYAIPPDSVVWFYGDSANVHDGFILIDDGDAQIPSYVVNALKAKYINASSGTGYAYFAARYVQCGAQ